MAEKSKLSLFIDKVDDIFARENFLKLRKYLAVEPFLSGNFQFYDASPTKADRFFKVKHNLPFVPKDFFVLSRRIAQGGKIELSPDDVGYYYPYADATYIYVSVLAPQLIFSNSLPVRTAGFDTLIGTPISVSLVFPIYGVGRSDVPFVRDGDPIQFIPGPFSGGAFPPPEIATSATYYAKFDPTMNGNPLYFQVAATPGGPSILSAAGTPATLPAGQTLVCTPLEFRSNIRFIAGAINDI